MDAINTRADCAVADGPGDVVSIQEIVLRNRHSLESIEETRGNTATHPPNYFINGQQRQSTANSANLNYPPTLRLRSLQPDQPRTLPNGASTSCSAAVKSVACRIKYLSKISLLKRNPSGVIDGADPYSNIRDACAGRKVKRSSYTCSQGKAPGGTTCLDLKVLQYIYYLGTTSRYRVQVNAIAGACHSRRSKHYAGKAVDLQLFGSKATRRAQEKAFRAACSKRGGWSHGGTHVHCQIV
uniref:Uncharacterized protein LOC111118716 isoform X2 n=1 Tax=Crassostrea virginica TaxID=6565 RepID=A0A8B8CE23_CRAVI|nr:uncharacterized protein LOC111118716 isoform X2 [Crassostrea virginica]